MTPWIAATLLLASADADAGTERLALIIAHNRSLDDGVAPLRFADDDGARFFELFSAMGYEARLLAILDRDTAAQHPDAAEHARAPSWKRLERTILELKQRVEAAHALGREVEIVITYSGHGAVGSRGTPYVNLLDRRLYREDFFRDLVAAIGADFAHVIVDACRARDFVDARGGPDGPDFDRALSMFLSQERRAQHPEVGVVVAESADGETHEWSRTRSGIFGHEVISGLAGAADVNGDGRVEYSELHAFVAAANHAVRDPRARLRVVAQAPALNPRRPVMELSAAGDVERIRTPMAGGRFTIEDDRGVRWVDLNLSDGSFTTLYLPRRQKYFVVDVERSREAVVMPRPDRKVVVLAALGFDRLSTASRGSIAEALNSDLFRTSFDTSFYEGFAVAMRYVSVNMTEFTTPVDVAVEPEPEPEPLADEREPPPLAPLTEPAPTSRNVDELELDALRAIAGTEKARATDPVTSALPASAPSSPWRTTRYISGISTLMTATAGVALAVVATTLADEAQDVETLLGTTWRPGSAVPGGRGAQIPTAVSMQQSQKKLDNANAMAVSADVMFGLAVASALTWGLTWFFD